MVIERLTVNADSRNCPHRKKRLAAFPSPAEMSFTKLSLGGESLVSDIHAVDGNVANLFLQCEFYPSILRHSGI